MFHVCCIHVLHDVLNIMFGSMPSKKEHDGSCKNMDCVPVMFQWCSVHVPLCSNYVWNMLEHALQKRTCQDMLEHENGTWLEHVLECHGTRLEHHDEWYMERMFRHVLSQEHGRGSRRCIQPSYSQSGNWPSGLLPHEIAPASSRLSHWQPDGICYAPLRSTRWP